MYCTKFLTIILFFAKKAEKFFLQKNQLQMQIFLILKINAYLKI